MSKFKDLYKQNLCAVEMQETRRRKLLEEHKNKRMQLQDEQRGDELKTITDRYKKTPVNYKKGHHGTFKNTYHSDLTLQLSEWMRQRPDDLCDWLLMPCPRGQRCMLVAGNGRTEMYSKNGRWRFTFNSLLPGGGGGVTRKSSITMLDCVYVQQEDAFYVLDALAYEKQDLLDCEAQFRFFWLRSKFDDNEELLSERSEQNEKPIRLLEQYDFENTTSVSVALQRFPLWPDNSPELDGFLFYHKEASYTCGTTPLVCWLFSFMVADVLGMAVSENYVCPADYVGDALQYMHEFDNKLAQKKQQQRSHTSDMDTSTSDSNILLDDEHSSLQALMSSERNLEMECLEEEAVTETCDNKL